MIKKLHLLYLLFVSLCFHNFYRLSFAYVLIPITIYLLLFLNIDRKKLKISNSNKLFISYLLILFMSLYIVAISFVSEGFIYTIIGITRYFYTSSGVRTTVDIPATGSFLLSADGTVISPEPSRM